jgi:hypothetical protein
MYVLPHPDDAGFALESAFYTREILVLGRHLGLTFGTARWPNLAVQRLALTTRGPATLDSIL